MTDAGDGGKGQAGGGTSGWCPGRGANEYVTLRRVVPDKQVGTNKMSVC